MKAKIKYDVVPTLPDNLQVLRRISYNLCFSWKDDIQDLFQRMDPRLWTTCKHNPVLMLGLISQERLNELSQDQGFVAQLDRVAGDFERYLSQPRVQTAEYCSEEPFQVAYFSSEFGLKECLPIYSGGLGILAGDHLKSASDLNVPLVGVGLLYQGGYFSQYLTSDGWQMEIYQQNDFFNMPVTPARDGEGRPVRVTVMIKDVPVEVQVWQIMVGRISLYMLDTNIDPNPPEFRQITAQLYGGDREMRLRQEIILGIGGVRALNALGMAPTVIHMNEGHSAFSALERINILRQEKGLTFDAAREVVTASSIFTTHTPVPAGNDTFHPDLIRAYFEEYVKNLGINFKVLLGYGRLDPRDENEPFGMTTLALRLSAHSNGVSRLHGKVSRSMWQKVWAHHPVEDVPIDHITNGIHVPTWISREMGALFSRYLGPDWAEDPDHERVWQQIDEIPGTELWRTHERCREHLVGYVRRTLVEQLKRRGASDAEIIRAGEVLTPEALTIGFARRFATYKRATLLFSNPDRLARLLNDAKQPVQVIIAGKAHPQDNEGKELIKHIIHLSHEERFRRSVVFLEDYNMDVTHHMVSGTDLWLNTPRRPLEACGTSGMKALANGSLNLSTLDGWWDEAYHRDFGWSLGHGEVYKNEEIQDTIESQDLYNLLENEIKPLFYQRGMDGMPRAWVGKMRAGLRSLVPIFNSHRMVQEYLNRYYIPCSRRFNTLCGDSFEQAKDLASWRQKIMTGWADVSTEEVIAADGLEIPVGQQLEVEARVRLGSLGPEDATVEAYYGPLGPEGEFVQRDTTALKVVKDLGGGAYLFRGTIPCSKSGRFGYTVRIMPSLERLENRFAMGLVTWA